MIEPSTKKRKVESNGHSSLVDQSSFSDVLQQLEAEDASGGEFARCFSELMSYKDHIETSAAWPRPGAPRIDCAIDSIGMRSGGLQRLTAFRSFSAD